MAFISHGLIVNDSRAFAQMTAHVLMQKTGIHTTVCNTLKDADHALSTLPINSTLVVVGLNLADAQGPDLVRHFTDKGMRVVVVTAMFDEETRNKILTLPVVDYVPKDSPACMDHLAHLVQSLERNSANTALVVDDSRSLRQQTVSLLSLLGFRVLEAEDGEQALALLSDHPEVTLVIADYDMPKMDGLEMTRRIRQTHPRERLGVVGLSGQLSYAPGFLLSARFLKGGANDFLHKPYVREEFQCRIEQTMQALDSYNHLRDMATRDFLTGLWNRRHFFASASRILEKSTMAGVAVLDIDYFKRVNDRYGHDAGDAVLRAVAKCMLTIVKPQHLLARFGGEEFCLLVSEITPHDFDIYLNDIREAVSKAEIAFQSEKLGVTISIGGCVRSNIVLEDLVAQADAALYESKNGGRNKVTIKV